MDCQGFRNRVPTERRPIRPPLLQFRRKEIRRLTTRRHAASPAHRPPQSEIDPMPDGSSDFRFTQKLSRRRSLSAHGPEPTKIPRDPVNPKARFLPEDSIFGGLKRIPFPGTRAPYCRGRFASGPPEGLGTRSRNPPWGRASKACLPITPIRNSIAMIASDLFSQSGFRRRSGEIDRRPLLIRERPDRRPGRLDPRLLPRDRLLLTSLSALPSSSRAQSRS